MVFLLIKNVFSPMKPALAAIIHIITGKCVGRIFRLDIISAAFSDYSNGMSRTVASGKADTYSISHGDGLVQDSHLFPLTQHYNSSTNEKKRKAIHYK